MQMDDFVDTWFSVVGGGERKISFFLCYSQMLGDVRFSRWEQPALITSD